MGKEWDPVELLRHSRHDWLNKLQLIKGNMALHRYERVGKIIEEIVIDSNNESKLSNLNMNEFATFLMTYNWEQHHFQLDFEVFGAQIDLSVIETEILTWCKGFFMNIEEAVTPYKDNRVSLSIELKKNEAFFYFDVQAEWAKMLPLQEWLQEQQQYQYLKLLTYNIQGDECIVELRTTCS
ncbi:Spo0B C-terminal domain-containing protein [Bacillus solimangrovi]|uniref:Sporulation initiation phosphotransferase B C-terminal domain-containing protein n=1 Tax=Bacillus solimangrovi TaxID=1305675 RepID=A0A1E5LBL1_9BACI|nr:Spo0B C-terminal domain-containing protein [Bacillus solimangrovi]OEH91473.1 hypothetical protein BFG57_04990 [Bacillus solimangrovi]